MTTMSDAPYNEWEYDTDKKVKLIANIHSEMYAYISCEIFSCVCDRFFSLNYADYYIAENELEKCRSFLVGNTINSHLLYPITDVALEIVRKNHPTAVQAMMPMGNEREYFSDIFIDTDFFDRIDENYWYLCRITYEDVRKMIIGNHRIIRYIGMSIMSYILECALSENPEQQMHKATEYAYKAAYELQRMNMDINWRFLYGK